MGLSYAEISTTLFTNLVHLAHLVISHDVARLILSHILHYHLENLEGVCCF